MAKPTGAVTAGQYYLDVRYAWTNPTYFYILLRVPFMPQFLQTYGEDKYLYKLGVSWQRKITDSTEDIETTTFAGNNIPIGKDVDLTDAASPEWMEPGYPLVYHGMTAGSTPDYPDGFPFNIYDVGSVEDRYKVVLIEIAYKAETSDATAASVYASYVDVFDDDAKSQSDMKYYGGNGNGYAYYDRSAGSANWLADEFVSSWEVMWAICDTYERIMSVNKPGFCVPMFGAVPA